MKQIRKLNSLLLAIGVSASLLTSVFLINHPTVLAAGCPTSASTDSQVTNQQNCKKKFIKDCKDKKFDAAFCDSLTVEQINKCLNDKGDGLKKACLEKLQESAKAAAASDSKSEDSKDTSSPSEIGGEYDANDCSRGLNGSCKLIDMIVTITNVLSGLAATVIVAMIVWGGIQYSMAGAEAAKVQAAKQKIINALLALLLLVFGFSIIQWLVPGGLI